MMDEAKSKSRRTNFYLTLDIGPGASHNEILHAYNRAKNTYSGGSLAGYTLMDAGDASSIMEEIEEAFAILGNPAKRREYDLQMGFNTWNEDPAMKPQNLSAADLLGVKGPVKEKAPQPQMIATPNISSVAAGIASIGDMSFEGLSEATDLSVENVIPLKPLQENVAKQPTAHQTSNRAAVGGVEFEANPEFEKQIQNCSDLTGEFLKAVRIYRRYTAETLALRCKLSTAHILTIENEDSSQMYQPVYLRGHVYLICHALDIPFADRLAKQFVDRMLNSGKLAQQRFK